MVIPSSTTDQRTSKESPFLSSIYGQDDLLSCRPFDFFRDTEMNLKVASHEHCGRPYYRRHDLEWDKKLASKSSSSIFYHFSVHD
jgi:hypothetical protein